MDENRRSELQHQAKARLARQRERVRRLRQRCIAASVVCFALLWGVIFTQMLTGNDPVLAGDSSGSTVASASTSRPATQAETSSSGDEGEEEGGRDEDGDDGKNAEQLEIEAAEAEASGLEAAEIEASEPEATEAETETEALTTSPS